MNDFNNINSMATLRIAVQRRIWAAMETGNFDQARTFLAEFADVNPKLAEELRTDIATSFGTLL